jgi:flagella synthesis protein FlgN
MNAEIETPAATLSEETRLTEQLIDLLKQEQAHLIKADIEGLMAITDEKSRAANEMSELTNRRYRCLAAAGYDPQEGGMRAWLDNAAPADIADAWNHLLTLAQSAKSLNSTNGLLINKHMSRNQQALNILRGNQKNNFYGPNGQQTSPTRSRGLALG